MWVNEKRGTKQVAVGCKDRFPDRVYPRQTFASQSPAHYWTGTWETK